MLTLRREPRSWSVPLPEPPPTGTRGTGGPALEGGAGDTGAAAGPSVGSLSVPEDSQMTRAAAAAATTATASRPVRRRTRRRASEDGGRSAARRLRVGDGVGGTSAGP